jgi:hypothetical protein
MIASVYALRAMAQTQSLYRILGLKASFKSANYDHVEYILYANEA